MLSINSVSQWHLYYQLGAKMAATVELLSFGKQCLLLWRVFWPHMYAHYGITRTGFFILLLSAMALLECLLRLEWPIAFSLLLGIILVKRLHSVSWDPCQAILSCIPGECSQSDKPSISQPYVLPSLMESPREPGHVAPPHSSLHMLARCPSPLCCGLLPPCWATGSDPLLCRGAST